MNKILSLIISGFFSLSLIPSDSLAQEESTMIAGTKISLIPPQGFVSATRFPGYQQEETNSSIVVTEIPASISELASGLTNAEELSKKGMVLLQQEIVKVNQQDAILINVQQSAYGTEFNKWILLLGNQTESVLLTATFPQELASDYSESLKKSLLTVQWNQTQTAVATDGLEFTLEENGDLKLAQRLGNSLIYTKNGVFPAKSINDPFFVVAPSVAPQYQELEDFARQRLLKTDNLTEIEIETGNQIVINNLDGYEIIGVGKNIKSRNLVSIYQVILSEENDYYYLMQGQVNTRYNSQYLPLFKKLAVSFQKK
ncbi:hypothetical protein Sta7437_2511 [Stanieria cyanosphaera PCC 7437]|uniref:Uncharacterized protein n=1 Tax=Stanieria cyanosphaera (strain ATCC 29371 / PCC 7437) TaxID=111780 RepID=K9XVE9_STAC7|nr:hypothetical protein [Stanieria cyanosphaera]AFZ36044.1 hypothetical protein Sta7437_2511 [Stanieria cyanosphaera PCC 7437]